VHASQTIDFDEDPAKAVRKKKDASIVIAAKLVADEKAAALVAAGSTGAAMAASLLIYGRQKGINRPAIAIPMPTLKGMSLVLDCGANPGATAENLVDYALLGSIYMEKVMGINRPKVGLLNIGEEESKGTPEVVQAYQTLKNGSLNFIGNIEGRDITEGMADVVVCDGFVGNIVLKYTEGLAKGLMSLMKEAMLANLKGKIGALLVKDNLRSVKKKLDYSEYGGTPLLGLKKLTIISHGSSNGKAIANALRLANDASNKDIIGDIEEALEKRSSS
ncbi:MAG: phosphate acyltransferase PlsX, partial [Bacillota bacterium]